jgi:hypothetical protein
LHRVPRARAVRQDFAAISFTHGDDTKMRNFSYALLALPLILCATASKAQAAGTITFTASPTSGTGSVTPRLTWSTSPVASSCTASGGWSGVKFASGSETVAAITANKTYSLTCTWGNGTATINWTRPTTNTDGSALTDLAGYKVLYGTSTSALTNVKQINDPATTSTSISALQTGTWYFSVRAFNNRQVESDNSNFAQKSITGTSAAKSLTVSVASTSTGTYKTVATAVYDVLFQNGGRVLGRVVGSVPLGTSCNPNYPTNTYYYPVSRTKVSFTSSTRSNTVVARCAKS